MNNPKYIIIHCSDSSFGSAKTIDVWHKQRGFKGIGYHFVINNGYKVKGEFIETLDGSLEIGRGISEMGAHTLGYNDKSIGVCLIGISDFSEKQFATLSSLLTKLMKHYDIPVDRVLGHYETEQAHGKTCPNIDMGKFRQELEEV